MRVKLAFLYFSRRERYGNTLLILTFLAICFLPEFFPVLFPPHPLPANVDISKRLVHFTNKDTVAEFSASIPDTLFPFDPNTADLETWQQLGISERVAQTILRYREKGGVFRKKEDLEKIYSLSNEDYLRLEPFIRIPESSKYKPKERSWQKKEREDITVDINQSSPEDWQRLRGIGPGYAGRILKFREKLGGFSSVEQVGDTYGLPDSVFQKIQPHLTLSPVYRLLSVNSADEETLAAHPYLSRKQARVLILFRQNHGPFQSLEDLVPIRALPDTTLQKLAPYLNFEPAS